MEVHSYIALLRGINVSGQKKILMADLRLLLEKKGFKNVRTYIQSGNVIFNAAEKASVCATIISEAILEEYGWEVPVLVKTSEEINTIFTNCPFSEVKKEKSYFVLLSSVPTKDDIDEIQKLSSTNEEFYITPNCVYIYYALGAGKAKLGNNWFEKKLNVKATSRNYRTMAKLIELVNV